MSETVRSADTKQVNLSMYTPHPPTHAYDDIIDLPHHVSPTRKRMSMRDRAAQFSPFAALTGYEAVIEETGRLTEVETELDESRKLVLNDHLQVLQDQISQHPEVTVSWFCPDNRKQGGTYQTYTGSLRRIDPLAGILRFDDHTTIPIDRITEIESPVLPIYI